MNRKIAFGDVDNAMIKRVLSGVVILGLIGSISGGIIGAIIGAGIGAILGCTVRPDKKIKQITITRVYVCNVCSKPCVRTTKQDASKEEIPPVHCLAPEKGKNAIWEKAWCV